MARKMAHFRYESVKCQKYEKLYHDINFLWPLSVLMILPEDHVTPNVALKNMAIFYFRKYFYDLIT